MDNIELRSWKEVMYQLDEEVNQTERLMHEAKGGDKLLLQHELKAWKHAQRSVLARVAKLQTKQEDS